MESKRETAIKVQVSVQAPVEEVWKLWTTPEDIVNWNNASDDWHTISAVNDLHAGGKFDYRMEAKDGSFGFDFRGTYDNIITNNLIEYTLADGRHVKIEIKSSGNVTEIVETFDAENIHPVEIQQTGWQSILNNFKSYVETTKLYYDDKSNSTLPLV